MHILITGFDAFDKADVNPSQQAVERISSDLLRKVGVPESAVAQFDTLATCCNEAWFKLEAAVKAMPRGEDFALILTGFAGNRNRICLERFALNARQYRIHDNRGHQWHEEYIDEKAPDAIRTKLPLFELTDQLNGKGLMTDISNYAGTFVCNETYFLAMSKWHKDPHCKGILFVHVPQPVDYVGSNPDQKVPQTVEEVAAITDKALDEYARAFAEIAKFIAVKTKEEVVAKK